MSLKDFAGTAKVVAVLCAGLAFAACAKTPGEEGLAGLGGGGAGAGGYGQGRGYGVDHNALAGRDGGPNGGINGGGPNGGGRAGAPGSAQDFAQNVGDRVFFESDSTDLTPKAQATLDRQVAWLQRYDRGPFTVEGNADERGTREYNFALGARRAAATKEYLVARGIPSSRVRTISYGKEHPVAVCNDISCWSQNRRAATVVDGGQS